MIAADTGNHRLLVWADLSDAGGAAAAVAIGQPGFDRAGEDRWTAVAPDTLCWPYGMSAATDPRYGQPRAIADSVDNRIVVRHRSGPGPGTVPLTRV